MVLSWAVLGQATGDREHLVITANNLFKKLEEQNRKIIIPAIVVGELLVAVDEDDHWKVLTRLLQDWRVVDYNLKAATLFARLRIDHRTKNNFDEIMADDPNATRRELIADVMIIATAMAHGASIIYSHDSRFHRMAEGHIPVDYMPDDAVQLDLNMPVEDGNDDDDETE
jgi:predicted nucleic acid-binding protein